MKTKFVCIGAFFLLFTATAMGQNARLQGGLNLANVSVNSDGDVADANSLTSFQLGIIGDIPLASILSIQPGIIYTGKGSKVQRGTAGSNGYYKQTFNPSYIEVPVNLVFKTPAVGSTRFFAGAGPYLAVGVAGKVKAEGTNVLGNYNWERDIQFSDDDPTTFSNEEGSGFGIIRRFDYGLNGTAGFEGKSIVFAANYGLGLAKLQSGSNSSEDNNNKHRVLSFTLGFKL